jgi:hypothetical protein
MSHSRSRFALHPPLPTTRQLSLDRATSTSYFGGELLRWGLLEAFQLLMKEGKSFQSRKEEALGL